MVTSNGVRRAAALCGIAAMVIGCGGMKVVEGDPGGGESPNPDVGAGAAQSQPAEPGNAHSGSGGVSSAGASSGAGSTKPGRALLPEPLRYSGKGFVVHEWGTDTVVVGSDGSLQRGLHHEEEDLPTFVYDRLKAGTMLGTEPSVTIKMETPVTYFYSDQPLSVTASVSFPKGVLTQWYPAVTRFTPGIAAPGALTLGAQPAYADPVLEPSFPFRSELCREKFGTLRGGTLDWGKLEVLGREQEAPELPEAPLEKFSWSYARDVDSNALRAPSGEAERFLFYRGLGEFDLPVTVKASVGGEVTLSNAYSEAIPSVFMLNVDQTRGAYNEHAEGIAQGASLTDVAPSLEAAASLDAYADDLGARVTATLDAAGLFHDEARAMVNTWKRQWFRTPGVRLLYVIPQSWTDESIPLSISPKPEKTLRVMLIRVELITPEQEAADVAAIKLFDSAPQAAAAHFVALGRFEEPRLRRALALQASAAASAYLATIQTAKSSIVSGE
ncbi:MAG TPA: hypothetical protein VJN18_03410 [Polyangiaceae bacterium]|nr:hypothetical protein [Polyangiaceae bacterium]